MDSRFFSPAPASPSPRRGSRGARAVLLAGAAAMTLSACQENPKTGAGAAIGAAAGGLLAAASNGGATGIAAGVLLGGLLGSSIGAQMDAQDKRLHAMTTQQALENNRTGSAAAWRNPDTGHRGRIEPTRTYQTDSGQYCREFQQTIIVGGKEEQAYGTACRQPDGSWEIQQG